mmetsp:Transcript_135911/g.202118  ORF Transcript_135911/g.202118 Transcript_135911/m.202118 type:complete len:208 (-) Transcript_135911:19-642(-)|eukprot:CAMPEP_0117001252 /NCGR_PEP_ID=MMETSP0472-20121206/3310_1 /TAXON_ID=693140 ORGANISM="Tiarina fusus, Strain LIS" /NCGR_SAMPLE_ID=MMETSP0472 /ASSEMBLY_ACC=CAM_ASM_000603 /LENGTH=207 /DNA_ID=CAMNT_0004701191 /DNA_START=45 /DNA_END=668 /DNA_ORIENTATION=-
MSSQHQTSKKSVTFAATASMRLARHITDYTSEEIKAAYYSGEDFREFKREIKRTLRMVDMKKKMDDISYCSRGVECLTKQSLAIRSKLREAARFAVLNKELHQFLRVETEEKIGSCGGKIDDERIAVIYAGVSRESATIAYNTGLADEQYAKKESSSSMQQFGEAEQMFADGRVFKEEQSKNISFQLLKVNQRAKRVTKRMMYNSAA